MKTSHLRNSSTILTGLQGIHNKVLTTLQVCTMWNYTRYLLMFIMCILLAVYTQGQQPSPVDPCKLYDFNTGLTSPIKQFDVVIKETDGVSNPLQVVKVPISGRAAINLVGETPSDTTTLTTYDIQFYYNSGNGFMEMTVGKAIDRDGLDYQSNDDLDVIQFNLECQFTSGGISARDHFEVTVRVSDSNDNPPVFVNLPYNIAIKEAMPVSTTVYDSISATDKDAKRNKEIQFAIIGGASFAGQTYFNMPDPGVGYVILSRSLDYEFLDLNNAKEFRLTISARDNAVVEAERRTSTSTVTVTIEDSDDLTPTFYHAGCRATSSLLISCDAVKYKATIVSGIVSVGSIPVIPIVFGTENKTDSIRAFDMDKLNAPVTFELIGSIPSGYENRFSVATSARETDAFLPGRDIYRATITQSISISGSDNKTLSLFIKARQVDDPLKYRIAEIDVSVHANDLNNPTLPIPTVEPRGQCVDVAVIGGGLAGGIGGIAVIVAVILFIFMKRHRKTKETPAAHEDPHENQTRQIYTDLQRAVPANTDTISDYTELNFQNDGTVESRTPYQYSNVGFDGKSTERPS